MQEFLAPDLPSAIVIVYIYINRIRMFVCLSVGYTLLIKPNSIHMLYNPNNASPFMSENVTLISFYHVFLI